MDAPAHVSLGPNCGPWKLKDILVLWHCWRYETNSVLIHCIQRKKHPFYLFFCDNFGKSGPIFIIFFTVKFKKDLRRKIVLTVPPPLKSVITLPCKTKWSAIQLYSAVNPVQNDEKRLIMVTVHNGCYFFVFLHRLIYVMCIKCPPSAHMCFQVVNATGRWMRCSMVCQTFIFMTERN